MLKERTERYQSAAEDEGSNLYYLLYREAIINI